MQIVQSTELFTCLQSTLGKSPQKLAYVYLSEAGTSELTFEGLLCRVTALAERLREEFPTGSRVVLLMPSGLEFVIGFLACLAAGVIAVPSSMAVSRRSRDRIRSIFYNCNPHGVIVRSQDIERLQDNLNQIGVAAQVLEVDLAEAFPDTNWEISVPTGGNQIAMLQYTSGSTAEARGVVVTHDNLFANSYAIAQATAMGNDGVFVGWLPLFHDMGLISMMLQPIFSGVTTVFSSPETFLRNPSSWLKAISTYRGTISGGPNFGYEHCIRNIDVGALVDVDLSCWKVAFNGAEPVRDSTLRRFSGKFAPLGFSPAAFMPCYGLAEATLMVTGTPVGQSRQIAVSPEGRSIVSCGKSVADTEVVIVDAVSGQRLPDDEIGEVWVKGLGVAAGYWDNPAETARTFGATIQPTGEGPFLRTGDLGFIRDEQLYICGRLKDLIIIRGRNYYPQDIETSVEQEVGGNASSCAAFAFDRNDRECLGIMIETNRAIARVAMQELMDDPQHPNQLATRIASRVNADFELIPASILFVFPGTFPKTTSGKVQRRACRQAFLDGSLREVWRWGDEARLSNTGNLAQRSPSHQGSTLEKFPDAKVSQPDKCLEPIVTLPDTASVIERKVIEYLHEYSGRTVQPLNHNDRLQDIGVDSLGVAELAIALQRSLGVVVSLSDLHDFPTIAQLANSLETRRSRTSEQPLLPSEHRPDSNARTDFGPHQQPPRQSRAEQLNQFQLRNRRFDEYRQNNNYFFETTIDHQEGAWVTVGGRKMLMLASYSYLGLVGDGTISDSIHRAISSVGSGAHGVRLLAGTTSLHRQLEGQIAKIMRSEASIVFSSGFLTNIAVISALVDEDDLVLGDEYIHASLADGCSHSRATYRTFRHNDLKHLETLLATRRGRRCLVVVDSVYSMEGDIAPLPDIVRLCRKHDALLMVDEAHSLGVLGERGLGIQEHFRLPDDAIDIKMGTLSKAIPSGGGFVAANAEIIDYLRHNARGYIFSGAPIVPQVAAAIAGFDALLSQPWRVKQLRRNSERFKHGLTRLGFHMPPTQSPIVPILFETEAATLDAVRFCRDSGLFVVPVFYPAVPMNAPRIRATVLASHSDDDIDMALSIFARLMQRLHRDESKCLATAGS